ncbi:AhpA/YtjB family protein [Gallaecimonas sp. GXIMD1310]|uniref:AhpA/YtjB family protein n=1 Tax=Gallaecimonas sp. GXIMD1310 TaxID=3131926 RepID=UPI0032520421
MIKKATPSFPGRRRRWLRLLALTSGIVLLGLLLWRWQDLTRAGKQVERQQVSVMTRALTSQAAFAAGQLMQQDDKKALQGLVNRLAKEPQLLDAAIYDASGTLLARSGSQAPVLSLLEKAASEQLIPYVSEIHHQGQVSGYLRITLSEDNVVKNARHYRQQVNQALKVMLALAFFVGVLLMAALRP